MKSSAVSASSIVLLSVLGFGCSSDPGDDTNGGYGGGQAFVGAGGAIGAGGGGAQVVPGAGGNNQVATGTGGNTSVSSSGGASVVGSGGAPLGGTTGAGGADLSAGGSSAGGAGTGTGGGPPADPAPCITDQKQSVALIGDSYITGAASPALQPSLGAIDPNANQYRNYAVAGTSMVSGGLGFIPPQWDQSQAASKVTKLVIMDGGGNDILICNGTLHPGCDATCKNPGSSKAQVCQDIVTAAIDGAGTLMKKMSDAGVEDIIFFYYPHIPANNGGYSEILDYAEPIAKKKCDEAITTTNGKTHCYFVSTVEKFKAAGGDRNGANFSFDGIHPSAAGQKIVATAIEDTMKANCLGQTSGCCKSGG